MRLPSHRTTVWSRATGGSCVWPVPLEGSGTRRKVGFVTIALVWELRCGGQVVEDLSGVVAVGERIHNFRCEFGQNRWIQKGREDLLCDLGSPWPHKLRGNPPVRGRADAGSLESVDNRCLVGGL